MQVSMQHIHSALTWEKTLITFTSLYLQVGSFSRCLQVASLR